MSAARRQSKAEALRALLSDGEWHTQGQLAKACGYRYSARLFDIHHDQAPTHYERREDPEDDSRVWYRRTTQARCSVCNGKRRLKTVERIRQLVAQVAALQERVAELTEGRT